MHERLSNPPAKLRCGICGKRFRKGGTRYRINLEIISDFNGYIEDVSKKPEDYLEKKIVTILDQTKNMSEKELEEEVYLKRNCLVCLNCREKFIMFLKEL